MTTIKRLRHVGWKRTITTAVFGVVTAVGVVVVGVSVVSTKAVAQTDPFTIVLVGGPKQSYIRGEHDYPDGINAIERLIKSSPQLAALHPVVKAFPAGLPADLTQIADADVLLMYSGLNYGTAQNRAQSHVLDDPARRRAVQQLMDKGAGLIALHQAFTVQQNGGDVPFGDWIGAVRIGLADRTTEDAAITAAPSAHPIARGVKPFKLIDEFYPTLTWSKTTKVTPVLTAKVHIQTSNNVDVFQEPAKSTVIGWAAERPNGGRSFAFTGGHYLTTFDNDQMRSVLLNAILWTAKRDVPAAGTTTTTAHLRRATPFPSPPTGDKVVVPYSEALIEPVPWGKLEWFSSRAIGNSTTLTTGQATVSVGKANPVHWHPNTDEVLHVVRGHIMHRVGDKEYEMKTGDTVTIPEGTLHNARNIGSEDAILSISFNTPDRVSLGE